MSEDRINRAPIDRYTSAHAGVGVAVAAWDIRPLAAVGIAVGWEIVENAMKAAFPEIFPYSSHDSVANAVTDTAANLIAYFFTRRAIAEGLSERGESLVEAVVGSTMGGIAGSILLGASTALDPDVRAAENQSAGRTGYRVGSALGGAAGAARARRAAPIIASGVGGAFMGPIGAGIGAWVAHGK